MNEVNEILRVLNVQIAEYKKRLNSTDDERLKKIYDYKISESLKIKKEILDKYDIPYSKEEDDDL